MENRKVAIEKLTIKLKVLESRIQRLEAIADEVINDVESEYRKHINELRQKKEKAQQLLLKIEEASRNDTGKKA